MVEFRWVWHDMKEGAPPIGCIFIGDRMYQKLQYRTASIQTTTTGVAGLKRTVWGDWQDVPHAGMPANAKVS